MLQALRDGRWLAQERIRIICLMLLAGYALTIGFLMATSDGRLDRFGRPVGTDFSQVWVAGKFVLEGKPAIPFDPAPHAARQRREFSETSGFFHWGYPPFFLLIAAFFALFPYLPALVFWQVSTLPIYLGAIRAMLPLPNALLAAAAFPAVFVNLTHGHNGFLTAGLMAFAVLALKRRPWLAGVLAGLIAYKPQFGLLLPLALLAGRHWRGFAGASLVVIAMTLLTWLLFGAQIWLAFLKSLEFSRAYVAEQGATGWQKIQSVFAMARMWGGSVGLAYAIQGVCSAASAAAIVYLWGRRADWRLAGAALMCASLLATPYVLDYDLMLLGPAIALYVAYCLDNGFRDWEKSYLAALWFSPLVARGFAGLTHVHIAVLLMAGFLAMIVLRAQRERAFALT